MLKDCYKSVVRVIQELIFFRNVHLGQHHHHANLAVIPATRTEDEAVSLIDPQEEHRKTQNAAKNLEAARKLKARRAKANNRTSHLAEKVEVIKEVKHAEQTDREGNI